jgi:hypothetical protein
MQTKSLLRQALFTILLLSSVCAFAQPVITSFSPATGPVGTVVTINGANFSSTPSSNIVFFGAVRANVTAATSASLTVTVPAGLSYEPIRVTTNGLTGYSAKPFGVTYTGGDTLVFNSFAPKADFKVGSAPIRPVASDLDGDGKADLVVTNLLSNTISVLRNTSSSGSISFANKIDFAVFNRPVHAAIEDLDGDGKPDVVVGNDTSSIVSVFRNISTAGNIAFAARTDLTAGSNPRSVSIRDMDNDGKPDILAANRGGNTISVFKNNSTPGTIAMAAKMDIIALAAPRWVHADDLDKDGKADLMVVHEGNDSFSVFHNISTGGGLAFGSRVDSIIARSRAITTGLLNGDDMPDIGFIVLNQAYFGSYRNTSTPGSIRMTPEPYIDLYSYATALSFADMDGDGNTDLVMTYGGYSLLSIQKNITQSSAIRFGDQVEFSTGANPQGLAICDIDGDGMLDMITANSNRDSVSVLRNINNRPPIFASFSPFTAGVGETVTIKGKNLSGVTAVSFGGTPAASFTIVSDSVITAVVATGTSGSVTITTPTGNLSGQHSLYFIPAPG